MEGERRQRHLNHITCHGFDPLASAFAALGYPTSLTGAPFCRQLSSTSLIGPQRLVRDPDASHTTSMFLALLNRWVAALGKMQK